MGNTGKLDDARGEFKHLWAIRIKAHMPCQSQTMKFDGEPVLKKNATRVSTNR